MILLQFVLYMLVNQRGNWTLHQESLGALFHTPLLLPLQQYILHIRLNYRATYNRITVCTNIDNKSQSYFKNY